MASETPPASGLVSDDIALPFRAEASGVTGRLVRLGPSLSEILASHDYPEPVSRLLGEAIVLTAILGSGLKFDGKLIFQTRTDGPVSMIIVNYDHPGGLRGYARFDAAAVNDVAALSAREDARLLGKGHFAMTIDQGPDMQRYQGIVELDGQTLSEAAHYYFRQSEQLPTFIRVAVAQQYRQPGNGRSDGQSGPASGRGNGDAGGGWDWRAGGLFIQNLAREGGNKPLREDDAGNPLEVVGEDEDWERTRILAATVEDYELVDPELSAEMLLYRLFHEEGVRAFPHQPLEARCSCSLERIEDMLAGFSDAERDDMRAADGRIRVTCEFCSRTYTV